MKFSYSFYFMKLHLIIEGNVAHSNMVLNIARIFKMPML